jgi:hypothetical protein
MSVARASAVDLAQRPTGALEEEEEPPAPEGSAPSEAPAAEAETVEPVEASEPGDYEAEEESYI